MKKAFSWLILLCLLKYSPSTAQAALALDRMNVLCPGIDNPLTVVVNDVPDSFLQLIPSMGEITPQGAGHYNWRICHRDTNIATLTVLDTVGRQEIGVFPYRVVRPPVPMPALVNRNKRGAMPNGEFKSQSGIVLLCEKTDWDIVPEMVGYDILYLPKKQDAIEIHNTGARFNGHALDFINRAKPGDRYVFYHFSYRIGCDPMLRYSNETLVFEIK